MNERFTDEAIRRNIAGAYGRFRACAKRYAMGMISADERDRMLRDALHEGFFTFLRSCGMTYRFTEASFPRFLAEHRLREATEHSEPGEPWLFRRAAVELCEASFGDELRFFRLMDAFLIPAGYFRPLPSDMPVPRMDRQASGTVEASFVIRFPCGSGGDPFPDGDPVGREYSLLSEDGLHARIRITRPPAEPNRTTARERVFTGEGAVEGYTSERIRPVEILCRDGQITCLRVIRSRDDEDAMRAFPLWQGFFARQREAGELEERIIRALAERFEGDAAPD